MPHRTRVASAVAIAVTLLLAPRCGAWRRSRRRPGHPIARLPTWSLARPSTRPRCMTPSMTGGPPRPSPPCPSAVRSPRRPRLMAGAHPMRPRWPAVSPAAPTPPRPDSPTGTIPRSTGLSHAPRCEHGGILPHPRRRYARLNRRKPRIARAAETVKARSFTAQTGGGWLGSSCRTRRARPTTAGRTNSRQDNWRIFAHGGNGEIRMVTPKSTRSPQRTDGDTSQAGCRGFESRPPLHLDNNLKCPARPRSCGVPGFGATCHKGRSLSGALLGGAWACPRQPTKVGRP